MSSEPLTSEADDWRGALAIILRNWRDELVALARAGSIGWRQSTADAVCLAFDPAEVAVTFETAGQHEDLGRFARSATGADALATRLAEAGLLRSGRMDVVLQFDDAAVLRSQVRLPKASAAALRGALGFELERLSPVPPAELYFDILVQNHNKATNRVEIVSRALRRRGVDDAVKFAQSAGLAVGGICMGSEPEPADWRYFPIDRGALLRDLWRRWGAPVLAGAAVLLLLAALLAASARAGLADDALNTRIADERTRAASVSRIAHKMDLIRTQIAFVAQRKTGTSFVAALAALTNALPDGTWLTNIQLDAGKLHIQGYSRAAPDLIGQLDRSGHFANSHFNAPQVRNPTDGTDGFDLTTTVVGAR
jgi:general secretion pathway protein L